MLYALNLNGKYYLQLEDDIIVEKHFITKMFDYVEFLLHENIDWTIINFSNLGLIGMTLFCFYKNL